MLRLGLSLLFLTSLISVAAENRIEIPEPIAPAIAGIGELVEDFDFVDAAGAAGKLSDYKDKTALVILASLPGCPIGQKYLPTVKKLEQEYKDRKVAFLLLGLGSSDDATVAKFLEKFKIETRYLRDKDGAIARRLQVKASTEAIVIDRKRTLVYRGPIDDQFAIGSSLPAPTNLHLIKALTDVLADKKVEEPAFSAPGCAIDAGEPLERPKVTYHNRISRIVQNRCATCHRTNGIASLDLSSFDALNDAAAMVRLVFRDGRMPPWPADGDHISNDLRLSAKEREDFKQWLASKPRAEGNQDDAPVPYQWPDSWLIGKPDAVYTTDSYDVPDTGEVPYQYFELSTDFAEDRYVSKMEVRPKEPSVVHHVLVFVNTTIEQVQKGAGLRGFFMGMVPGQSTINFPQDLGKTLPKGAKLVFQVHYTPSGIAAKDRIQLGFKFADKKPAIEVETNAAFSTKIDIAPFAKNVPVSGEYEFSQATRLLAMSPHMHARGVRFDYELLYPDGRREKLLEVPRFDFNWQFTFWLRKPVDVPKGTKIVATGTYDNSTRRNGMDPSQRVVFGEQTSDEMMIGYFYAYPLPSNGKK